MGGRSRLLLVLAAALVAVAPARAHAGPRDAVVLDLKPDRLAAALQDLAVRRQVGILFAPDVVAGRTSPRVAGALSVEQALDRLLDGSDLTYRRLSDDRFVVERAPAPAADLSLPEILVVARKSQNADIRRTETDIQPYQVQTGRDLTASRNDQVGAFIRERFTFDAHGETANAGTGRSTFNIHGLSVNETLVLVDGMRMPSIPVAPATGRFAQPDLNGLPLSAVDRIEALTATSGGIYGPGATAGVVNVVLRRDYRGAELTAGLGVTARGDALRRRIEGRVGFTPDDGRTEVMVLLSHASADGLRQGQRGYDAEARAKKLAANPAATTFSPPASEGIVIASASGNLALKPALGGQSLGAPYVLLPTDHGDLLSGAGTQQLLAGAASKVAVLSMDAPHDQASLIPSLTTTSAITSVRHAFGPRVEGFADLIYFRDDSETYTPVVVTAYVPAAAANNPFRQQVTATFTAPGFRIVGQNRLRTYRLTSGLIVQVADGWKAEAAYSRGGMRTDLRQRGVEATSDLLSVLSGGDADGKPVPNVFGDWATLTTDLQAYKKQTRGDQVLRLRFQDANVRLAGPLARTPAGPVTLSLVGEWRKETALPAHVTWDNAYSSGDQVTDPVTQDVASLYGELRAPLVSRTAGLWPLRGLEVQAAARYDDSRVTAPDAQDAMPVPARGRTVATVLGLRLFPLRRLMLRANIATGALPPWPDALKSGKAYIDSFILDPRRGNRPLVEDSGDLDLSLYGQAHVKSETARTTSVGLVLNPDGRGGPRVSLDYTRIAKRGEIIASLRGAVSFFLTYESLFPDRVTRAPLTAADRAAGYTGGVVTAIDASAPNAGSATIEAIDLKADQTLALRSGLLRLYGSATFTGRFDRTARPDAAAISYLNALSGPLKARATLGADLDHGPWTVGLNAQVFGAHSTLTVDSLSFRIAGGRVPAQAYLDLNAAYRFDCSGSAAFRALELRFGVANLLDHAPPTGADGLSGLRGYSPFGDPRGRRFDLSLSARF